MGHRVRRSLGNAADIVRQSNDPRRTINPRTVWEDSRRVTDEEAAVLTGTPSARDMRLQEAAQARDAEAELQAFRDQLANAQTGMTTFRPSAEYGQLGLLSQAQVPIARDITQQLPGGPLLDVETMRRMMTAPGYGALAEEQRQRLMRGPQNPFPGTKPGITTPPVGDDGRGSGFPLPPGYGGRGFSFQLPPDIDMPPRAMPKRGLLRYPVK